MFDCYYLPIFNRCYAAYILFGLLAFFASFGIAPIPNLSANYLLDLEKRFVVAFFVVWFWYSSPKYVFYLIYLFNRVYILFNHLFITFLISLLMQQVINNFAAAFGYSAPVMARLDHINQGMIAADAHNPQ